MKLVDTVVAQMAAQAAREAQPAPRRITFSAAGRAFIDEYVDMFKASGLAQRR